MSESKQKFIPYLDPGSRCRKAPDPGTVSATATLVRYTSITDSRQKYIQLRLYNHAEICILYANLIVPLSEIIPVLQAQMTGTGN
jgi:hypothetical protein